MAEITVGKLLEEMSEPLELKLVAGEPGLSRKITLSDVSRPGLALIGYFEYFQNRMIQVLGLTEISYLNQMPAKQIREIFSEIFRRQVACMIFTRNLTIPEEVIELGNETGTPVIASSQMTTPCIAKIYTYLEHLLAPRTSIHGVLVDVFGVGILITGESGIGKSECALELVERGHRLVADDVVDIVMLGEGQLVGSGAELIKYHMEVRGLGIINVRSLFGLGAVKDSIPIELMVQLEEWNENVFYDRLGIDDEYESILGVKLSRLKVPVRPGRNLSIIIEVAARNQRSRQMGYHSAREFNDQLLTWIKDGKAKR